MDKLQREVLLAALDYWMLGAEETTEELDEAIYKMLGSPKLTDNFAVTEAAQICREKLCAAKLTENQ